MAHFELFLAKIISFVCTTNLSPKQVLLAFILIYNELLRGAFKIDFEDFPQNSI